MVCVQHVTVCMCITCVCLCGVCVYLYLCMCVFACAVCVCTCVAALDKVTRPGCEFGPSPGSGTPRPSSQLTGWPSFPDRLRTGCSKASWGVQRWRWGPPGGKS